MAEKMLDKRGLTREVPASYDNISEQGEVLYLDEERLHRKERHDKPVFKNHPHGLGVKDAFWPRFSARPWNFGGYAAAFHAMKGILHWSAKEKGPQGNLMRSILMMNSDRGYSGGTAYNLNVDVDLTDKARNTVIPIDLVKEAIRKADYIGAMDKCLCRTANNCQRVPHDIACMFLGRGGREVTDHRIAHEISTEEALAKVDRATVEGLVCMSLWVQVEQLVWGLKNEYMSDMVEICFCCPCCCTALNLCKDTTPDIRRRFSPSGFTATVDHDLCIGCGKCVQEPAYCPQDAIQFRGSDGKMVVNQETCMGCGYCKERCPMGAIKIQQTMPMRESMHDYFLEEVRLDLAVDGNPGAGAQR